MSTEKIYKATIKQIEKKYKSSSAIKHLDIGPGTGTLIGLLRDRFAIQTLCCDYTNTLMELPDQHVDIVDLNVKKELPYADNSFDVVTAIEVIEHLEDFRTVLREIHRVLKPEGICVISTPNILNINSRLRNLWVGFAALMGPIPVNDRQLESTAGHINPVSFFYVMHALHESDFREITFTIDKLQKSGIGKAVFWWLPIKLFGLLIFRKEKNKYKSINESNKRIIRQMNSLPVLLSRTIIFSAVK